VISWFAIRLANEASDANQGVLPRRKWTGIPSAGRFLRRS
jgi:hypothetical protein